MAQQVGRFAPTPSGRMHLGNVLSALLAWLSVRKDGGMMILRIEDLDRERTSSEKAEILKQDLKWLGLDYDLETQPQSQRSKIYEEYFEILKEKGLLYPCYCTRAMLHSLDAPHLSDGTYIYPGTCKNLTDGEKAVFDRQPSWRIAVPDRVWSFEDRNLGFYSQNLQTDCGDFILRRADGAFVYQLAVTVDDGLAGVTQVVRGQDLLSSSPRQMYLQELLGFDHPTYAHIPLLVAQDGRRLSKRDRDLDLGVLRQNRSAEQIVGFLAHICGLTEHYEPVSPRELVEDFSWEKVKKEPIFMKDCP